MWTATAWRRAGAIACLAGAAQLAAACGSSSSSRPAGLLSASAAGNSAAVLKTEKSGLGTLLTNGTGYTLYWFGRDTAHSSACTGACTSNWPPVTGTPKPAPGISLPGRLGTIARSGGLSQATYDGHPLYTYSGDFEPGDIGGNNLDEFGGRWYAITISGGEPTYAPAG
jgi:predicted lipoprotein with Yx(FWY)xxD motif